VIQIICDCIVSNHGLLLLLGRTDFSVALGRGDGATNGGGLHPRDAGLARGRTLAYLPFDVVLDEEK
jgi:error-prone DNA polymerase